MKNLFALALVAFAGLANAQTPTPLRVNFVTTADGLAALATRIAGTGFSGTDYANGQIAALDTTFTNTGINAAATRVGWEASSKNAPATADPQAAARALMTDDTVTSKHDANGADVTVVVIPCQNLSIGNCVSAVTKVCTTVANQQVIVITEYQLVNDPSALAHEIGHLGCARHPNDPNGGNNKGAYVRQRLAGTMNTRCFDDVMETSGSDGQAREAPQETCYGYGPTTVTNGILVTPIAFTCDAKVFCNAWAVPTVPKHQPSATGPYGVLQNAGILYPSTPEQICDARAYVSPAGDSWITHINPLRPGSTQQTQAAIACTPMQTYRYSKDGSSYIDNTQSPAVAYAMGSPTRDAATAIAAWLAVATNNHNTPLTAWGKAVKFISQLLN